MQETGDVSSVRNFLRNNHNTKMDPTSSHEICDTLMSWFNHGYHDLVEKTFLNLTLKAINTCSKENPDIKKLKKFYQETGSERIRRILEIRRRQEWISKDPIVGKARIAFRNQIEYNLFSAFDMIADDQHVAIAAFAGKLLDVSPRNVIFVMDAKRPKLLKVLEIGDMPNWSYGNKYVWIKLAINEDYLIANAGYSVATEYKTAQYDQFIWFRKKNFEKCEQHFGNAVPQTVVSNVSKDHLIADELRNRINISEAGFYWPIIYPLFSRPQQKGRVFHYYEFDEHFKQDSTVSIMLTSNDRKVDFMLVPKSSKSFSYIAIESGQGHLGRVEGSVGLFCNNEDKIWQVKKLDHSPRLIGQDQKCLVIVWRNPDGRSTVVNVLDISNGNILGNFDCHDDLATFEEAKVSEGRVAIAGKTPEGFYDVIVWDLPTGDVLYRCASDMKLELISSMRIRFVLDRNRILILTYDSQYGFLLLSANFWI